MKLVIAVNTLTFHGYPLDTALEEIARLAEYVEPVYIVKYDPTLREEYFNGDNARTLSRRLEELGLKIMSMGSHMDLGRPDSVAVFRKRMEFAKAIGARTILTNAGRKSDETAFYGNMEKLAAHAETLDLLIALENPGDGHDLLLGCGIDAIAILERVGSDRVRLNYDISNVFTYSKGKRRPEQELASLLGSRPHNDAAGGPRPYIGHLHLKNVKPQDGAWPVCSLDEGIIDYRSIFRQFPALWAVPMSIELPLRFGYDGRFDFVLRETLALPLERIRQVLTNSLEYLRAMVPSTA